MNEQFLLQVIISGVITYIAITMLTAFIIHIMAKFERKKKAGNNDR